MAGKTPSRDRGKRARVELHGLEEGAERPALVVHALDAAGDVVATAAVDEQGEFRGDKAFAEAETLLIGPSEGDPADVSHFLTVPAAQLREVVDAVGSFVIPSPHWRKWLLRRRCVEGTVRRCFPTYGLVEELVLDADILRAPSIAKAFDLPFARLFPPLKRRCAPVCFGSVEVYRRVCCCRPPIVIDDFLDRIREIPELVWPTLEEPPGPIDPPGPGPDPAPFELRRLVLTGGAVDERKVRFAQAEVLAASPLRHSIPDIAETLRLLWCRCRPPVKVGEGFVRDGGSFTVCWWAPRTGLRPGCREEFAYVVKQPRGDRMVTIYDGVAANQWFDADDEPTLTSYSLWAVGCRHGEAPITGAAVALEAIGRTDAYHLSTPAQTAADRVGSFAYNSGLLHPAATPTEALGQFKDCNLGGNVGLLYQFTERMKQVGAVYYRVQVAKVDHTTGAPGAWAVLAPPMWRKWKRGISEEVSVALGPHNVNGQTGLSLIPYQTGGLLDPDEDWLDKNQHALIPTRTLANGRHLVMLEVFDVNGNRLKPLTAPAAEAGTGAQFEFRLWDLPHDTSPVPFAALTHVLWWDNRAATAEIVDIRRNGTASSDQCQFIAGKPETTIAIGYRAYHPQPGTPSFLWSHELRINRGLSGPSWQVANPPELEVGEPPAAAHVSMSKTLDELLGDEPVGRQRCAFAVTLHAWVKTTDGDHTIGPHASATAAFAAEITHPPA